MIRDIESNLGRSVKIQEYDNIQEEAQALLTGRVEAAVYNNAFLTRESIIWTETWPLLSF